MGTTLVRGALRQSIDQVRHVSPVRVSQARGLVARIYTDLEDEFGMLAPPISLHSPAPRALAVSWLMLRETLIATGTVARQDKEAVAAAVSKANACPYCVEVHSAGGQARDEISFSAELAPELIGVAVTFQYLNRMVNVFLDRSPIPAGVPNSARRGASRVLGWLMRRAAREHRTPGTSLDLLPEATLPDDLRWAAPNPTVAGAFARAAAAVDAFPVAEPVREVVLAELSKWDGHPRGISRAWLDAPLSRLPSDCRPAGKLALLTAFASYQVDQRVIDDFRRCQPDDESLIVLTSWASLAAARQVGAPREDL